MEQTPPQDLGTTPRRSVTASATKAGNLSSVSRGWVVEVLGGAGSGKTTLTAALLERMTDEGLIGYEHSFQKSLITVDYGLRFHHSVEYGLRNPHMIEAFLFLLRNIRGNWRQKLFRARNLISLGVLNSKAKKGEFGKFIINDSGIVQCLSKLRVNMPPSILSRLPMPDIVIELRVPVCDMAWRRALRDKPVPKEKIRAGPARQQGATRFAELFVHERGQDEAWEFLTLWNQRVCSPTLSEDELRRILNSVSAAPPPAERVKASATHPLKAEINRRGNTWLEFENPTGQPMSAAVDKAMKFLRSIPQSN